ncbi:MAG TPA: orotidine-5'-phosphate decarboxylase [Gemmatimonadaceae bacterium]|jgi:orotidine-5'-phosphate decarboxylase|nr:orotidine-5'-phosphate decarboxylase [Gemmatimonadaceae bacterium]
MTTSATPRIIVALDVPSAERALALADSLGPDCDFVKVGSELFTAAGPQVVRDLAAGAGSGRAARDIFLDLKFHDIPATVRGGARSAAALGATLLTVHASGGREMIEAAVEGAGQGCGVLAVTILTSLDANLLGDVWGRRVADLTEEALRLADMARAAGAHGVVCSGHEAAAIRERHGDALKLLVPGIRLAGGDVHDQRRVSTPSSAVAAGASYLILGRAVTAADDPVAALARARNEAESAATAP